MNFANYTIPAQTRSALQRIVWWFFTSLFIIVLANPALANLPKPIKASIQKYTIPASSVSALVVDLDSQKSLLSHLAGSPRNPASVMKLLTTYAALDILGPAHSWKTEYYLNGELKDGTLTGDLVIRGNGDPYLVKEQFWLHLAALRERGLRKITGNLLIDNSAFDLEPFDESAFDKQPTRLYNVGPSPTVVNFNASRFRLQPKEGRMHISLDPPMHNISINNQLTLANGKCRGVKSGWSMTAVKKVASAKVTIKGKYRKQCGTYDLQRTVLSSNAYLFGLFTHLWRNLGGEFNGKFIHAEIISTSEPFYTGSAKTLAEVINGTNKYSNNLLARQLLLSIGHHQIGQGASVQDGITSIKTWLKVNGLDFPELVMQNGAGLARKISISASSLNKLLRHAYKNQYQPEFLASFPLGGLDGTMKKRMKKMQLGGRARLKTGYVNSVRTLAGYLRADSGKNYAVVLFIDSPKVNFSNGNLIQDTFIKWVLKRG